MTGKSTVSEFGLSASCLISELTVSELVCQQDVCEAEFNTVVMQCELVTGQFL